MIDLKEGGLNNYTPETIGGVFTFLAGLFGYKKIFNSKHKCKDVEDLKKEIKEIDERVKVVEQDLEVNTQLDKQLRKDIKSDMSEIKRQNELILNHLLNK